MNPKKSLVRVSLFFILCLPLSFAFPLCADESEEVYPEECFAFCEVAADQIDSRPPLPCRTGSPSFYDFFPDRHVIQHRDSTGLSSRHLILEIVSSVALLC